MNIKITGASGYLGKQITNELKNKGFHVSGITRQLLYGPVEDLKREINGTQIIINLAGATILQRWTKKKKKIIYDSRVKTTENLVKAICELPKNEQPEKFISASAIGIYKAGFLHDENSTNFDDGFIGKVVKDWENMTSGLPDNTQKFIFRIGLVLGRNSKTIKNLLIPFKLGLGATIGKGDQPFPFVHEQDVLNAFLWAVTEQNEGGIFNLTAPDAITNDEFSKKLAKKLHRPLFLFLPKFVLKILFGESSVLLIDSPEISSEKLVKKGFIFDHNTIDSALDEVLN